MGVATRAMCKLAVRPPAGHQSKLFTIHLAPEAQFLGRSHRPKYPPEKLLPASSPWARRGQNREHHKGVPGSESVGPWRAGPNTAHRFFFSETSYRKNVGVLSARSHRLLFFAGVPVIG